MIDRIREYVNLETPTGDGLRVNALAERLEGTFAACGARVTRFPRPGGDILYAEMGEGEKRALLIGHMDTVFPAGACEKFDMENGRLYGAGVSDMKAGLCMMTMVFERFSGRVPKGWRLGAIVNADEETGSLESASEIARLCEGAVFCLCFEPSPPGRCALTRKGILSFQVDAKGVAAHASAGDPARKSAIRALTSIVQSAYALESERLSVNIGHISGGGRVNVVADRASARGEFRSFSSFDLERAQAALDEICARVPGGARASSRILAFRPPLEKTDASMALYAVARACAAREGLALLEQARGGGSDGALVAARGVPVLDGMGAEGGRAHTRREFAVMSTLEARLNVAVGVLKEVMSARDA